MLKYLWIFLSIIPTESTQCSCGLGYRNGAQSSDANLCMGPAESSGRPCYPPTCNANLTACNTELWKKDTLKKVICNDTQNVYLNKKTSEVLSLREILFILLILILSFTNGYSTQ